MTGFWKDPNERQDLLRVIYQDIKKICKKYGGYFPVDEEGESCVYDVRTQDEQMFYYNHEDRVVFESRCYPREFELVIDKDNDPQQTYKLREGNIPIGIFGALASVETEAELKARENHSRPNYFSAFLPF